ncbi:GyrI-like domain-containing protein [Escherichia coli]|uniref:AraC family transcriptional regulator n=1 Tax=Escherichia coli TaxID=562 RepID=UPI001D18292C|nr:GyrI-like domain-containing protein [Escherichia coli]MCC4039234.1 GyrI-like domain-containing protein [Escherichia coli]
MKNQALDVNIINFPSTRVALLPHRCSPELLNYSVAKFIMWRKETGLSPVNQSQTFGVAWDDPVNTAPEAFRFDICGSVSEAIPENRYGVSNSELGGGRYAVARHVGELDDISRTVWGIIRQWLPESGEKIRKAPILFHYTNLAEGMSEQRLETDVYVPLA